MVIVKREHLYESYIGPQGNKVTAAAKNTIPALVQQIEPIQRYTAKTNDHHFTKKNLKIDLK